MSEVDAEDKVLVTVALLLASARELLDQRFKSRGAAILSYEINSALHRLKEDPGFPMEQYQQIDREVLDYARDMTI